jgi:hypothetical protein
LIKGQERHKKVMKDGIYAGSSAYISPPLKGSIFSKIKRHFLFVKKKNHIEKTGIYLPRSHSVVFIFLLPAVARTLSFWHRQIALNFSLSSLNWLDMP